jgi:hypothetical protein
LFYVVCFDCDFGDGLSVSFGDVLVSHAAGNSMGPFGLVLSRVVSQGWRAVMQHFQEVRVSIFAQSFFGGLVLSHDACFAKIAIYVVFFLKSFYASDPRETRAAPICTTGRNLRLWRIV